MAIQFGSSYFYQLQPGSVNEVKLLSQQGMVEQISSDTLKKLTPDDRLLFSQLNTWLNQHHIHHAFSFLGGEDKQKGHVGYFSLSIAKADDAGFEQFAAQDLKREWNYRSAHSTVASGNFGTYLAIVLSSLRYQSIQKGLVNLMAHRHSAMVRDFFTNHQQVETQSA